MFKTRKGLDRILDGKGKVTLGGDVGVAAGPVGRQAEVATDAQLKSEIFSYSRSRGLFAGVALDGAAIIQDADSNFQFAQRTLMSASMIGSTKQGSPPNRPATPDGTGPWSRAALALGAIVTRACRR